MVLFFLGISPNMLFNFKCVLSFETSLERSLKREDTKQLESFVEILSIFEKPENHCFCINMHPCLTKLILLESFNKVKF